MIPIPGRLKAGAAGLVLLGAFSLGWTVCQWRASAELSDWKAKAEAAARKAETAARETEQNNATLADAIVAKDTTEAEAERVEFRTVIKETVRYVKSPAAGHCRLPDDWVRVHNLAAGFGVPEVPDAPAGPNGLAGPVAAAKAGGD